MFKAIKVCENVYWVGVHDFNVRNFHGSLFPIDEGSSYNAYLVIDDEITLFDTVEDEFYDQMMQRIKSVIGDKKIDNLIVQHTEPDHSGGFLKFMEAYPNAKVYASASGATNMMKQYFKQYDFIKVKTNDTINTGKYDFVFVEMPMIHWPDNMLTYMVQEKVVFSNDAFGQHVVSYQIFDEQHELALLLDKAKDYYANIVMPYNLQVTNKLKQILAMNLEIDYIAPAHGIIWHKYIPQIIEAYQSFSSNATKNKAVIVYDSVWNHTDEMAHALAEGFGQGGMEVKLYKVSKTSPAIILKELLDAEVVMVGSGNYNNFMAPSVAAFLEKLASCKVKNKKGLAFGAYGWANVVAKQINERLKTAGIALLEEQPLSQNYTPSENDLENLYQFAYNYATNK